jgi:hypothetical protein
VRVGIHTGLVVGALGGGGRHEHLALGETSNIAACSDAFVLTLLGATNVAVYDGSLLEWAPDPTLPIETD